MDFKSGREFETPCSIEMCTHRLVESDDLAKLVMICSRHNRLRVFRMCKINQQFSRFTAISISGKKIVTS